MKKTLIAIAVMVIGISVFAQAKDAKVMKQYGPADVVGATDSAAFGKDVMEIDVTGAAATLTLTKLGKDLGAGLKNKVTGPSTIPVGYASDGSKWDFSEVTATIVGFKSKTVFVKYVFGVGAVDAGMTRYYCYNVGKDTISKFCKINGSTSNISVVAKDASDGKNLWIQAAKDGYGATVLVQMLDKKLNGTVAKPKNPKAEFPVVDGLSIVLPTAKDQYTVETVGTEISTWK